MDLSCPYCACDIKVNHDDGFGYAQDVFHQMECHHCEKSFVFTTTISFSYDPQQADCLNDGEHDWQISNTYPRQYSVMECLTCGETRGLTVLEKQENGII